MPIPRRARQLEDDEHPRPERVGLVRWSRVYAGLLLIVIGIIWSLVNSRMGVSVPAPSPTPTVPAGALPPALGQAQTAFGRAVNAKLLASVDRVAGNPAPAGERYLLIAVQVVDRGAAFAVAPTDFELRAGARVLARGRSYPGHAGLPAQMRLHAGSAVEGTLVFAVPRSVTAANLAYSPRDHPRSVLIWRVATPSR